MPSGGGMLKSQHQTLVRPINQARQAGFSLVELILSTGLAAMMMAALMASLMQFNRHKLVAQVVINKQSQGQLATAQILRDWADVCALGVAAGSAELISLRRLYEGQCVAYSYGFNASSYSLKRRRASGRYSSFLAQVESVALYYGVDSDGDCRLDQWHNSYIQGQGEALHQVRVMLTMRSPASSQLRAQGDSWLWHDTDDVVLHKVETIWQVPHDCS